MKPFAIWMLVLAVFAVGCEESEVASPQQAAAAPAETKAPPPAAKAPAPARRGLMQAVVVGKGPAIDGTLKDPAWQKCPELELGQCTSTKTWPLKTTARVLFDATRLYAAFVCQETDTAALKADTAQRDGDVWQDDSVELFVTGDLRTGYYHFAVNPKGVFMDTRSAAAARDDKSYNSSAAVKASVQQGKGWTVTLSVPLAQLGGYVGKGQTWIVNLNRTRPARGDQPMMEWSWAVMGSSNYHQVQDFGRITAVSIPRRDDGVTRTATPPPPPPKFDEGKPLGGVLVYRHFDEMTLRDRGQGTARAIDLMIRNARGLKVAFLARGTGGVSSVPFNMADKISNDNTTSKSYRHVTEAWGPVLYYVDRFRYNGGDPNGRIGMNTMFTNLRFHGNQTGGQGVLELREVTIYRGEDAAPPPAPKSLRARVDDQGVHLTWDGAKDNAGVALYVISRAGKDGRFAKIAESALPQHLDKPPAAGAFKYRVLAVDFQDNVGPWSQPAPATAAKGFGKPKSGPLEADRLGYAEKVRAIHKAGKAKVVKGRVLCFGDSITGATMYRVYAESALGRYQVEAMGRAGWRTDGGRRAIAGDLKQLNPQFCLVMYGTNNSKAPQALPKAMEDLLAIAKACEDNGTVPIIATIPPRGFGDPLSKPEVGYNAALIKTCRDNQIPIAYVFEAFQAGGDRRKLLAGDGVHLVGGGWAVTGPAWREALDQVNFVLLDRP